MRLQMGSNSIERNKMGKANESLAVVPSRTAQSLNNVGGHDRQVGMTVSGLYSVQRVLDHAVTDDTFVTNFGCQAAYDHSVLNNTILQDEGTQDLFGAAQAFNTQVQEGGSSTCTWVAPPIRRWCLRAAPSMCSVAR